MRKLIALLLALLLCSACTALPAEERAFAVVLCVEKNGGSWRVHGRIPTYQTVGEYLTVTGAGDSFDAALAAMDAAAPMRVHLSQLRLLVLHAGLGSEVERELYSLSDRADVRPDCAVAVTQASTEALMDALKPAAGARLSKAIDVLLDTRMEQGCILSAALGDVVRMGEHQSPLLINLTLEDDRIELSGSWPITADMRLMEPLSGQETALLSMLRGEAKSLPLTIEGGVAQVRDVSAKILMAEDMQSAAVELTLRATASSLPADELEQRLAAELLALLSRLSAAGCDVLGLGRKAILQADDAAQWRSLAWPEAYRKIHWTVSVGVNGPA